MAPYQYSQLSEDAHQIRLLTLLGGNSTSEICILIHVTPLLADDPPVFEALSYTWGSAENLASIKVGHSGKDTLNVTQNLLGALFQLRDKEESRVLWIDAICIDQQNLKERGHQVERMGDIYRLAQRVIVWLGPEENDSTYALDVMENLSTKIEVDWLTSTMKPVGQANAEWVDRTKPLPYDEKELLAIYSILDRPWFERLWIRQEIRLANYDAILLCGSAVISWQSFRNAIFCLRNKIKKKECLGSKVLRFHERIVLIFDMSDDTTYIPLGRLIRQTKYCKCSDPRDRIYAVLSILDESERAMGIKPDYTKTTSEVYQDLILRFITHFKVLQILTSCEMQDKTSDMPTWVPNWALENIAEPLWGQLASGESLAQARYLGGGILSCTGVQSATIKHAERIEFANTSNPELIRGIRRPAPPDVLHGSYKGGGSMFDAYCRTICCDTFGDCYSPPLSHFPDLQQSKDALLKFLGPDGEAINILTPGGGAFTYLDYVWNFCKGRSFFMTKEGYLGLGPRAAKAGDQICVLLGCQSPLVLRPTADVHYQIVGECFVYGLMNAEAFLGPLPSLYKPVLRYDEGLKKHVPAYLDHGTGDLQSMDPRLTLPTANDGVVAADSTVRDGELSGLRLTPEELKERGVDLRTFAIV